MPYLGDRKETEQRGKMFTCHYDPSNPLSSHCLLFVFVSLFLPLHSFSWDYGFTAIYPNLLCKVINIKKACFISLSLYDHSNTQIGQSSYLFQKFKLIKIDKFN